MGKELVMSDLKLTGISVMTTVFERNPQVDYREWEAKHDDYQFSLTPSLGSAKKNPNAARVILAAQLFSKDYLEKKEPFYLHVKTAFYFQDTAKYTGKDNVLLRYAPNMVSMAFPYVRSYLQTITALSGITSVAIPAINVFQLMQDISEKKGQ